MTEAEWLAWPDPRPMLREVGDRPGSRKLRLFACACCREIWDCLTAAEGRTAVEVGEREADGLAVRLESEMVADSLQRAFRRLGLGDLDQGLKAGLLAAYLTTRYEMTWETAHQVCTDAAYTCSLGFIGSRREQARDEMFARQARLLRCIVGNPFQPALTVASRWLVWNDGTLPKIARVIYNDRTFDRLPILADALEDAGCANVPTLYHCRTPGEHARGCWVLDLLLKNGSETVSNHL